METLAAKLRNALNWVLGTISLILAAILFWKREKSVSIDQTEEKILTTKVEIGKIEQEIKTTEETRASLEVKKEEEIKAVINDQNPQNIVDFFNNRLNKQ